MCTGRDFWHYPELANRTLCLGTESPNPESGLQLIVLSLSLYICQSIYICFFICSSLPLSVSFSLTLYLCLFILYVSLSLSVSFLCLCVCVCFFICISLSLLITKPFSLISINTSVFWKFWKLFHYLLSMHNFSFLFLILSSEALEGQRKNSLWTKRFTKTYAIYYI